MSGFYAEGNYPDPMRRIKFYDEERDKKLVFLRTWIPARASLGRNDTVLYRTKNGYAKVSFKRGMNGDLRYLPHTANNFLLPFLP